MPLDNLPTIESDRVRLRWMTESDVDGLYRIFSDPEVSRYWSSVAMTHRDEAVELLKDIHDGFNNRRLLKWGVADAATNELMGTVTLMGTDLIHRRAEIGYALARAYWGKGYIQEALRAVLKYAFNELNLHRIEADVDPRNTASIKTLERLGFQREGYLRERWQVGGEIQDALFYGLLRPEWKE